jgi:hypothetical protein
MATRRTRAKDLKRRTANRPERKTILVFCEGEASEPDYINGLKRLSGVGDSTAINIEIDPGHGMPLTLVERAIARNTDDEVDERWCVFDVEWPMNHPHLKRALSRAAEHGIRVAVSNPCFELWLILHYENQTAYLDTAAAVRMSRKLDGRLGKRIDPSVYMERRQVAAERAARLGLRHAQNQSLFPDDNPSSTMYELLATIESRSTT